MATTEPPALNETPADGGIDTTSHQVEEAGIVRDGGDGATPAYSDAASTDASVLPSQPEHLPFVVSGERLKAQYASSLGTRSFAGLYDTALDANCTFQHLAGADPDALFCVPGGGTTFDRYLDSTCTSYAYVSDCSGATGEYVYSSVASCPGTIPTVQAFRIAEEAPPSTQLYYKIAGYCLTAGSSYNRVFAVEPLGAQEMVQATTSTHVAGGGFKAIQARGTDGSRLTVQAQTEAGVPCSLEYGACLERNYALVTSYNDVGCSVGVVNYYGCGDPPPTMAAAFNPCGREKDVYAVVTERFDEESEDDAGACGGALYWADTYGISASTINDSLLRAEPVFSSDGLLQSRTWQSEDGVVLAVDTGALFEGDAQCANLGFSDGLTRCISEGYILSHYAAAYYFADEECQTPLYESQTTSECGQADPPRYLVESDGSGDCGGQLTEMFELVEHLGGIYALEDGQCASRERDALITYLSRGRSVPLSGFPVISLELDP